MRRRTIIIPAFPANDLRAVIHDIMGDDAKSPRAAASILMDSHNTVETHHTAQYFSNTATVSANYVHAHKWMERLKKKYPSPFATHAKRFDDAIVHLRLHTSEARLLRQPGTFAGTLQQAFGGPKANFTKCAKRVGLNGAMLRRYLQGIEVPGQKNLSLLLEGLRREFPNTVSLHPLLIVYADLDRVTVARITRSKNANNVFAFRQAAGLLLRDVREQAGYTVEQVEDALKSSRYPRTAQGNVTRIEESDTTVSPSIFKSTMLALCQVFNLETVDPQRNNSLNLIAAIIGKAPR